jgi:hypothetical protein
VNFKLTKSSLTYVLFIHFWFLVTFGDKVMKILCNRSLHFARQDGQDGKKNWKENHATKVTKIPKSKRRKYGMNET